MSLKAHIAKVSKIVNSWPAWKRDYILTREQAERAARRAASGEGKPS